MFATAGLIALLAFVFVRPHDIVPGAARVPVIYVCFLAVGIGWALDVRLRLNRPRLSPVFVPALLYAAWSLATLALAARHALVGETMKTAVSVLLLLAFSQGIATFRSLRTAAVTLLAITGLFVAVSFHQARAPLGCVRPSPIVQGDLEPLGTPCATREDCRAEDGQADMDRCERVGLLGTTSIEERVRYRGILQDPNELAVALIATAPFAIALYESRRTFARLLLAVATIAAVGGCTILTKSRSGQLAFLAMIGAYFLRRYRWAGLVAGAAVAVPVLLFGGRQDQAASVSKMNRADYWQLALELAGGSPVWGAGKGQFTEHSIQTAHNSFMLVLAEQGAVGLLLWTSLVYMAFKTAALVYRAAAAPEARVARLWATALLSSLGAFMVSGFFLSLADHNVLWIYLGLAGALAAATARHAPGGLDVRFGLKDLAAVAAVDAAVVGGVFVYVRFLAWA
jgi:hypothetical protein